MKKNKHMEKQSGVKRPQSGAKRPGGETSKGRNVLLPSVDNLRSKVAVLSHLAGDVQKQT